MTLHRFDWLRVGAVSTVFLVFMSLTGCNGCDSPTTKSGKDDAANEETGTSSDAQNTEEGLTESPPATESGSATETAPTSQGNIGCVCTCVVPKGDKSEPLCNHFTMEKVKGEATYVCDKVYAIRIEGGTCSDAPASGKDGGKCAGFDPKTKAGPIDGQLAECKPG
jgi:hypothetical protein